MTYVLSLLNGLCQEHQLTIAAPHTGRLYKSASNIQGVRVLAGRYTSRPLTLIAEVKQLRRFLKQERFDVVHVNGGADHRHVMLATLGLRHRPAIVWTKHNTNPVCSLGHRLRARFGTHASIAVCDYVSGLLSNSNYRRSPIYVVRNGIDIDALRPIDPALKGEYRQTLFGDLGPDALILGSIGGTDYNKGWLVLVEAVMRLEPQLRKRVHLVVAGDPPSQAMLQKVRSLGLEKQVIFPGLVSDIRKVLGACDIGFVLSFREAASYASCETMAMGIPALVSDAGGLPENVRCGRDGWVVPAGDTQQLSRVLTSIISDTSTLTVMGRSARERVEQLFAMPSFLEETKKVYSMAIALAQKSGGPI